MDWKDAEDAINNVLFINKDPKHLKKHFLVNDHATHRALYPEDGGIIIIDFDTDTIINYQNLFTPGTIMRVRVNRDTLSALYDAGKIILDKIDYMIDARPFNIDNYDADYPCEADLARYQMVKLGFTYSVIDAFNWGFWSGSALKRS